MLLYEMAQASTLFHSSLSYICTIIVLLRFVDAVVVLLHSALQYVFTICLSDGDGFFEWSKSQVVLHAQYIIGPRELKSPII